MIYRSPPMFIKALIANLAVEAFNIGILIWFSGLDKLVSDLLLVSSGIQNAAGKLRAVVSEQAFGLATQLNELIEHTGYMMSAVWSCPVISDTLFLCFSLDVCFVVRCKAAKIAVVKFGPEKNVFGSGYRRFQYNRRRLCEQQV